MRHTGPDDKAPAVRGHLRKLLSFSTLGGLVPLPATFRPFGVSAIVIAKNEEDWVETSIRSILDHVDEVVISDHGSEDGTGEIMRSVAQSFPGKVRLVSLSGEVTLKTI